MEFETEWERRNYERQKKLELNRFTFVSHHDENALRRKRRVVRLSIVGGLVGGIIIVLAVFVVTYKLVEGDRYTVGEILKKIYVAVIQILKMLPNPKLWETIWNDIFHGTTLIRLKWFFVFGQAFLVVFSIWSSIKQTKKNYAKQIVIDLNTNEIAYKDNEKTAKFNSTDIEQWKALESIQRKRLGDVFFLKDKRMFHLDGFYQNDLHEFLVAHKEELKLPKLSMMTLNEAKVYM